MSGTATRGTDAVEPADPWWGDDPVEAVLTGPPPRGARRSSTAPRRQRRRRSERRGSGIGWLLVGVVAWPFDLLGRLVRRSPRLRRVLVRLAVVVAVLAVLACSVGVILINNVVIGRTAELGELDDRRRELRRDNAVLGAQAARLEAPDLVHRRATKELGMVTTDTVPPFVYLYDGSRTLNARQRRRVAQRAAQAAAADPKGGAAKAAASKQQAADAGGATP